MKHISLYAIGLGLLLGSTPSAWAQAPEQDELTPEEKAAAEEAAEDAAEEAIREAEEDEQRPTDTGTVIETEPTGVEPEPTAVDTEDTQRTAIVLDEDREEERGIGLSVTAGGGVVSFVDEDARNSTSDAGVAYDARLHIGTRSFIGLEVGYQGTAQALDTFGVDDDALLLSNSGDAALRVNVLPAGPIRPYLVGGAAWKRYSVENTDTNTSSVRSSDDVIEFPVGAGLAAYFGNFVIDLRGQYRLATDEELVRGLSPGTGDGDGVDVDIDPDDAGLDNWTATLRAGVQF